MAIIKETKDSRIVTTFDHGGLEWCLKKTVGGQCEIAPVEDRPITISSDAFATSYTLEYWLERASVPGMVRGYNSEHHPTLMSALDRAIVLCSRQNGFHVGGKPLEDFKRTTPAMSARRTRQTHYDEKVERIKALADEGHTAEVIGSQVGMTKNAVIGLCHRRGIELRGKRLYGRPTKTPFRVIDGVPA